jgi:hypothetical protein
LKFCSFAIAQTAKFPSLDEKEQLRSTGFRLKKIK